MEPKFSVRVLFLLLAVACGYAQNSATTDNAIISPPPAANEIPVVAAPIQIRRNPFVEETWSLVEDQKALLSSPAHMRFSDATWLVPLGGIMAGLFVTDNDTSRHISKNPATLSHYDHVSQFGVA